MFLESSRPRISTPLSSLVVLTSGCNSSESFNKTFANTWERNISPDKMNVETTPGFVCLESSHKSSNCPQRTAWSGTRGSREQKRKYGCGTGYVDPGPPPTVCLLKLFSDAILIGILAPTTHKTCEIDPPRSKRATIACVGGQMFERRQYGIKKRLGGIIFGEIRLVCGSS